MRLTLLVWRGSGGGGARWRVLGTPMGWVLVPLTLALLVGFVWCVGKYLHDAYVPYEGEVVAIERSSLEWLILESSDDEHLTIRTPDGKMIDRVVPMQHRVMAGIGVGDYVVKKRGFSHHVSLRKPTPEHQPDAQP